MKKNILIPIFAVVIFSGCAHEFNQVYKSQDYAYKYEYAKEAFANGKYSQAISLLQELVTFQKGTDNAEESLYMLAMAQYRDMDYEGAAMTFKKYRQSYPKGIYAEMASFYIGESLYMSTPEPRFFELQDKLVKKEYYSAQLYYNLGTYFGNCTSGGSNYEACIITAQNAINDYPYNSLREEFAVLIMMSKFELAQQSVEEKKLDRYRDAEDECYGFINEYPDSENVKLAEKYIASCKKITKE